MSRRKWLNPCNIRTPNEDDEQITPLNLPVPSKSPTLLNLLPDFKMKSNFFKLLGLKTVPSHLRQGRYC